MNDEVVREVLLNAPLEEVWEALTDPERLAAWLAEEAELQLVPGGEARFRLEGGKRRTGFVDAVEPRRRLSFWWRSGEPGDDGDAEGDLRRVEFTLVEVPAGTRLRVVETREPQTVELRGAPLRSQPASEGPPAPHAHAGASLAHSLVHA